jgi:hypothetical protein
VVIIDLDDLMRAKLNDLMTAQPNDAKRGERAVRVSCLPCVLRLTRDFRLAEPKAAAEVSTGLPQSLQKRPLQPLLAGLWNTMLKDRMNGETPKCFALYTEENFRYKQVICAETREIPHGVVKWIWQEEQESLLSLEYRP